MARILVIDDEAVTRFPVCRILQTAGYEVEEASDGQLGLELYRKNPADLVITDIFMPGKDGFEIVEEIRTDDPKAKIITTTGGKGDDCAKAKELGAARTFVKPFLLQELLAAVKEVLGQ